MVRTNDILKIWIGYLIYCQDMKCNKQTNKQISIQINHQPDATIFQFIILTFIYSSTCFGRSPVHHQELNDCSSSLWFYLRIVIISARPRTQHDCHHDTKVKPEAGTAVIELLLMGGRKPETRWAVNKRQDNKLENCCIWLVIYLNSTMMHGITNLKKQTNIYYVNNSVSLLVPKDKLPVD